jgi:hypothetical protein
MNINRALEYNLSFLSLPGNSTGLKEHRIPAQQKAVAVGGNYKTDQDLWTKG